MKCNVGYPSFILFQKADKWDVVTPYRGAELQYVWNPYDIELDSRAPLDTHYYFGDCAGKLVFLPIEKYDNRGQFITSEMIGYDGQGNEVWL